jgi:hypothetical protein
MGKKHRIILPKDDKKNTTGLHPERNSRPITFNPFFPMQKQQETSLCNKYTQP